MDARGTGRRASRALLLALGVLAGVGCAAAPPEAAPPSVSAAPAATPALWRAAGPAGRGDLYLLGSVHLDTGAPRFGPEIERAYGSSQELVVELDPSAGSPQEKVELARRHGLLAAPTTVRDVVAPPTLEALDAYAALRQIEPASLERFKPWFLAMMISQMELERAGYREEFGVDRAFIDRAFGEKPLRPLETFASQLEMWERLTPRLQELMLDDVLSRSETLAEETRHLHHAWQGGDTERLSELVFGPLEANPEFELFYDVVVFQRNRQMAAELVRWSADGRTRFVVVGAAHMLGEQGLPTLLAARGFEVERLDAR